MHHTYLTNISRKTNHMTTTNNNTGIADSTDSTDRKNKFESAPIV